MTISEQIKSLKIRFQEINKLMLDSSVLSDRKKYIALSKEHGTLNKTLRLHDNLEQKEREIDEAKRFLLEEKETGLIAMAEKEMNMLTEEKDDLYRQLENSLIEKDPNDEKNCVLEIRAGTGGNEAAIWAGDLFRMYHRFIEDKGHRLEVLDYTEGDAGGYKEIICNVHGKGSYGLFKYESGIHRVQRIPATETQGRIHTSAASIVVLPQVDEVTISIDMNEIRKDTFCSSGPGGQSVNTTYSAVRLTHLPTGIVATCQDEKSQLKNYEKALQVLRARLYQQAKDKQQAKVGATRKSIVGTGDRSEKIRTYNYPEERVTDHRIKYTCHNLTEVLNGSLQKLIDTLHAANKRVN